MSEETTSGEPRSTDPECLFCRIAAGEVPAEVVHQDEATVGFRDVAPQAPTHVLVVPRHHAATVAELARERPDDAVALLRAVGAVAAQEQVVGSGYRSVFNSGADAQQSVLHAHVHVLGGRPLSWPPG